MNPPVYRDRDFLIYATGSAISWLGVWVQRIAIGWVSWELTHSAVWVGVVSMVQFLPMVFLGPFFGVLTDQLDRKKYAVAVNSAAVFVSALLFVVTALGALTIVSLTIICTLLGVASSAYQATRLALVNDVVGPERRSAAIAINSMLFNASRFLGPLLGGVAIAWQGVEFAFAVSAIAYLGIVVSLIVITIRPAPRKSAVLGFTAELIAGVQYTLSRPAVVAIFAVSLLTSFFGRGVLLVLPIFADLVFTSGSTGLALLTAGSGVGAVLGSIVLARLAAHARLQSISYGGAIAMGVALSLFALAEDLWVGVVLLMVLGFASTLCGVGLQIVLQSILDDDYRGRVLSLWGIVTIASPALGSGALGYLYELAGIIPITVAAGALCAILSLAVILTRERQDPAC